ncbi:MAG: hypothetical protein G01um10143_311 [Parcubacteria group bacterium Gr01-1014_3]|nr:MAG: hypothetical protein G01um10143_311 [Parcubacteria group bacterium Gr01-1014_3]
MDSHKSIQEFLRELKSRPPNNRSDNERLFLRYNEFILSSIADYKRLASQDCRIDWDDVYQDAAVALLEIAKDPDIRGNFSTYVQREIINSIRRSVETESQFKDFVSRLRLELRLYQKCVQELHAKLRRTPTTTEIAKQLGLPSLHIAHLKRLCQAARDYEMMDYLTEWPN